MNRNRRYDHGNEGRPPEVEKSSARFAVVIIAAMIVLCLYFQIDFTEPEIPPEVVHFWEEAHLADPDPLVGTGKILQNPPKIGQYLHILGSPTKNAESFCVTLMKDFDDERNIACRVCAYFEGDKPRIEYHAYQNGTQLFDNKGPNPFAQGEQFDLRIRFLAEYVQVFAQRGEIGIFRKLPEVHEASHLKVIGDVTNLRLMEVDGGQYATPYYRRIDFGLRLDIALKPVAEVDPALWQSLIEGQPMNDTTIRVKRKGGGGGGRGGGGARGGGGWGGGSRSGSGRSGGSSRGGGFNWGGSGKASTFKTSSRSSYRTSAIRSGPSGGYGYGRSHMGFYWYSPMYGGYYHSRQTYSSNSHASPDPSAHFYAPASYSYRNPQNGSMAYSLSDGHGKHYDPNNYIDLKTVPKPQIIDILFYKAGDNTTDPDGLMPTFKVSFLFSQNATTLSRRVLQNWVNEERANFVPMDDWRIFDLVIRSAEDRLKIYVNNFEFANYELYPEIKASEHIGITGDVEILGFKENGILA